jgi:hypothetical protein
MSTAVDHNFMSHVFCRAFCQATIDVERKNMVLEALAIDHNDGDIPTVIRRIIGCKE